MYTQIFLVTSVRGKVFAPQIAASSALSVFGAKMPLPAFFIANAFFFPAADMFALLWRFFSAVIFFRAAFVIVVFVVSVVVVISIRKWVRKHTRLEPWLPCSRHVR